MKIRRLAVAMSCLFAATAFAQNTIFLENFSTDGDGVRYTMFGRGSDTSPDAWEHTFALAQSSTFPLGAGGDVTLAAPRIAIPWQSTVSNPTENAIPFFDAALGWATTGDNLNVSFLVNDGPSEATLAPGDATVFGQLESLGHSVNLFDVSTISNDVLDTTDLLVVSDSANAGNAYRSVNLRNVPVPVINYSTALADDLLLSTSGGSVRELSAVSIANPMSSGLPSGLEAGQVVDLADTKTSMPEYGPAQTGVLVPATYLGPFARSIQGLSTVDAMIDGRAGSLTGVETIVDADLNDNSTGIWAIDNPIPLPESPDFTQEAGDLDQYAVVSRGTIEVTEAGGYVLGVGGDDGGRLRINGDDVIVDDSFHGFQFETVEVNLPAGEHSIEWVGFEGGGGSGFELSWIKAEDYTGNANADFFDLGDPISTQPVGEGIVLKDPGLEVTAHFLAPDLGPDVPTENPAVLMAPAGLTFTLPTEPFENPTGDYLLGTDMDSIPGNDLGGGVLEIPADGEPGFDLTGVSNPKLSIDVASTFSVEEGDAIVVLVNDDEIARVEGNELAILQDEETGTLVDSSFRTLTWDLPSGLSEARITLEVGAFSSSGEAVGIDQIRITDGDPEDAKVPTVPDNRIQQGSRGYEGLKDTEIRFNEPDADLSEKLTLNPDGSDGGGEVHGLTKFNDLIGDGENQIPADANVENATLNINIVGPGTPLSLHRMLVDWEDATANWNFFGGGIQADDIEAVAEPDDVQTANTGVTSWNITDSIKAWQADPERNNGWVMLPLGTNGVDYLSAEGVALETGDLNVAPWIDYVLGEAMQDCIAGDIDCDGTVSFLDFLTLANNFGNPGTREQGDLNSSGTVDFLDFLELANNFGNTEAKAASVPEPTSFWLATAVGCLALTVRRRR